MLGFDRRRETYDYLQRHGSAKVAEIAERLNVSVQTVRRDLAELEQEGLVERVHGGAVLTGREEAPEGKRAERAQLRAAEKRRIGAAAAELLSDGDTIFLSGGTTTEHVVPWLERLERLTVITNAIVIAAALARHPHVQTIVLGGTLRHEELTLLGPSAEQSVEGFRIDHAIYGCYGLDPDEGILGASVTEVSMDRTVIARAQRLTVLADGVKFSQRGPMRIAANEQIKTVVTDESAPSDGVARLRERGVEVIVA